MQLALGTVQFGLAYGIAGRDSAVSAPEARAILARAHALGVRSLDTAAAYGDIESRLADLCGDLDFAITTKLAPRPRDVTLSELPGWTLAQLEQSLSRLGPRLRQVLVHRADDLLEPGGDAIWTALADWGAAHGVHIGVSAYAPAALAPLQSRPGFAITQLPGNAIDQRIARAWPTAPGFEVQLRSAFLQGLLLMREDDAVRRVPAAAAPLASWHAWCRERDLDPLAAALSVVKSFAAVDTCVVGVDRLEQLEQIAAAWQRVGAVAAPQLHCDHNAVIDPRQWSAT